MKVMDGIFAVYKPKGMTSHDVVDKIREITGERSVGHAGTLDPLAEGVLVIGVGDATKDLQRVVEKEKEYFVRIKLGEESTTDDAEGEKRTVFAREIPRSDKIVEVLQRFKGKIKQVPPLYSAVKVEGKESYKWMRRGEPKELKPREVEIKEIEIISYDWPNLSLRVVTGPGCYIRSLARDLGRELKTGGYVQELFRTRVGEYTDKEAIKLEEFPEFWKSRHLS